MKQPMVKSLATMAVLGIALGAAGARASPEEDRQELIKYYTTKYPNIRIEDYVYGSLAFDSDSKPRARYDAVMQSPPYRAVLEKGRKMWETPLRSGKTYADCLPNGGRNIAGNYPYFDETVGKVITLENAINACRVANGEEAYKLGDKATMGTLTAYMRSLSDGMPMNIRVEGPRALAAYEDGKKTFFSRLGQLNFSCATCHVQNAGVRLRSELTSPAIGQAVHWPVFRGEDPETLQSRYVACFESMRHVAPPQGSDKLNNLEYFHSYLSNGLPLKASVFRE